MITPVKTESLPDKIASQIINLITEGKFKTGEALPSERKLAEMFNVGRSSVREAMKLLETSNFIQTYPGKKAIIKNFTEDSIKNPIQIMINKDHQKIVELTKVRVFLESYGARDAALNRTEEDIEKLQEIISKMESDFKNNILNFETDFKFHTAIAGATKNLIYIQLIENIHDIIITSLKFYREILFISDLSQRNLLKQHKSIFEAIKNSNPEKAEKMIRKHLEYVIKEYSLKVKKKGFGDTQ